MSNSDRVLAFARLGRLVREYSEAELPLQSLSFAAPIVVSDAEVLSEIQEQLEEEIGRIDRIFDVSLDDSDTFRGKIEQKISGLRSQFLKFALSPSGMSYVMLPAEEAAKFAEDGVIALGVEEAIGFAEENWWEVVEFAAAAKGKGSRAGMKLNCKPGNMQCGGKCQSGSKNCTKNATPEQKAKTQETVKKAKAKSGKTAKSKAETPAKEAEAAPKPPKAKKQPKSAKTDAEQPTSRSQEEVTQNTKSVKLDSVEFASDSDFKTVGDADWHGIKFVQDEAGQTYARRQNSNFTSSVPFDTASEVVAINVMRSVGIDNVPAIKVQNVSEAESNDALVRNYSQFVPGITYESARSKNQVDGPEEALMLSEKESFAFAASHPDLARIYAFDVYSFNGDRHSGNLMYDRDSDRYYAIDNEGAFYRSPQSYLSAPRRDSIEAGMEQFLKRDSLSDQEVSNLREFHQTLTQLVNKDPDEIVSAAERIREQISTAYDREEAQREAEYGESFEERRREAVTGGRSYALSLLNRFESDFKRHGVI